MTRPLFIPGNVETDGNLLLLLAPMSTITSWPPKQGDLELETTIDITYSLTVDGWNHTKTQEDTTDERLTLREVLGGFGKVTHALSLTYFYGSPDDVVDPLLVEGDEYAVFARYAKPYEQDIAPTDEWDILRMIAGTKVRNAPAANGKWTKTQALKPRAVALEDYKLAA